MKLNFGHIKEYNFERGFGFVTSELSFIQSNKTESVFFHIKKIAVISPPLKEKIDNRGRNGEKNYSDICFWYIAEDSFDSKGKLGLSVSHIWLSKDDIPSEELQLLLDLLRKQLTSSFVRIEPRLEKKLSTQLGQEWIDNINSEKKIILEQYLLKKQQQETELALEKERKQKESDYLKICSWYEDRSPSHSNLLDRLRLENGINSVRLNKNDIASEKLNILLDKISIRWVDIHHLIPDALRKFTSNFLGDEYFEELNHVRTNAEKEYKAKINKIADSASEEEVSAFIESASEFEVDDLWLNERLIDRIEYRGFLWNIAKPKIKKKIILKRFPVLLKLDDFERQLKLNPFKIEIDSIKAYSNLNDSDRELAKTWINNVSEYDPKYQHELAKMLSARTGEKFVLQCYSNLGFVAKDISIQQLSNQSSDWKNHDVLLNNKISIDVKNARRKKISGSQGKYSEFCVPRFKANRDREVIISGVLSPYLKLEYINEPSKADFKIEPIVFLGEMRNSTIESLEKIFLNNRLKSITMPRGSSSKYIPPWLFEYPDAFYRNQIEAISNIAAIKWEEFDFPSCEDLKYLEDSAWNDEYYNKYLKIFLFAGIKPPQDWLQNLTSWQNAVIEKLLMVHKGRITLPYLYMLLLSHFLDMLSSECLEYHPRKYKSFILPFLGIYDPLNLIDDLCETLSILWDNRIKMNINDFSYFKFDGRGILKGKRDSSDREITILAYCGGWKGSTGGTCGFTPLLQNKHENCEICKWLKCPECGYCGCQAKDNRLGFN
jgi:cold shock CspA family protein